MAVVSLGGRYVLVRHMHACIYVRVLRKYIYIYKLPVNSSSMSSLKLFSDDG